MKALRSWKRLSLAQNILHWLSMKNLTFTPDLLYAYLSSFVDLFNHKLSLIFYSCNSFLFSSGLSFLFSMVQDDLDEHVDVTDSRLRVQISCSNSFLLSFIFDCFGLYMYLFCLKL